jgi:hypothetical protein
MLVVGDMGKVQVVQRIYHEYINELRSLREIAARLNRDGIPSPNRRGWCYNTVAEIIANPAYVGDYARERNTCGKYSTIRKASVVPSDGKRKRPREEWTVEPDHHEALIDRDTYNAAQAILGRGRQERSRRQKDREPALFTCRLRCGKCGALLYAVTGRRLYECSTLRRQGAGASACPGTTVKEDTLLVSLAEHLEKWIGISDAARDRESFREWLTADDPLPAVYEEVRNLIAPPPASTPRQDRKSLEKHTEKLRSRIKQGQAGLAYLTEEERGPAREDIQAKKNELKLCEEELERTKQPTAAEVNRLVEGALESLFGLALCCRALARYRATRPAHESIEDVFLDGPEMERVWGWEVAAPQAVRQLLARIGHIVIHTTIRGKGTRTRHQFERGEIVFRSGPDEARGSPLPSRTLLLTQVALDPVVRASSIFGPSG